MRYTIQNEALLAEVDDLGAELRILRTKADGHDFLWCGDPAMWGRVAPVLFPFVGGLKDDSFKYQNKKYTMQKHGFARKTVFSLSEQTAESLVMTLTDSPETMEGFPFPFRLDVRFTLEGGSLTAAHTVTNTGGAEMWFSLGAHPSFACDLGDVLRFEKAETLDAYRLENDLLTAPELFLNGSDAWRIQADSFLADAQILENPSSRSITLERQNGRGVRFGFNTPYLGIWAKPGAPYVCLEPWFGVDDHPDHNGELTAKKGIQRLAAGECLTLTYTIETL